MTAGVIGISLALPGGLHLLLNNIQTLSGGWDASATISLYMRQDSTEAQVNAVAGQLSSRRDILNTRVISRDQALDEFRRLSGFAEVLETLDDNPLPMVLVVQPTASASSPEAAQALANELGAFPEVDFSQLDLQWLQRFQAITAIAGRMVWVLAALLCLAVLLIVVNTIRLEIQNRRAEIEITQLVGATDAFIRRPFIYIGFWYGLIGGTIGWLLIAVSLLLLEAPVARLTGLYNSGFQLSGMGLQNTAILLGCGVLLGIGGSWIAVGRHLSSGEPT